MRLWERGSLLFAIFLLPVFLGGAAAQQAGKAGNGDAVRGKKVFQENGCFLCHNTESDEAKRPPAPSLKGVFKRPLHKLADGTEHKDHTDEMIRKIVTEGTRAMNPRGAVLTDEELNDLMAYLHTL